MERSTRNEEKRSNISDDTSKKSFVLFMAEVINCSVQTEKNRKDTDNSESSREVPGY